jgi:protein-S-isoprenylcysteine O-methyltransferase Ste14
MLGSNSTAGGVNPMHTTFFWGGALISTVVVSWFFYRYVAPKSWRDWTRWGIVQAFIISFYAEMYGFPVTIYFLARIFGLDAGGSVWDSNLWIYLTGTPAVMLVSMAIGYTVAFLGVILLIAGWREVYLANKQGHLATGGPYALCRHPQYLGIFLALIGEGVIHWPTVFSLTAVPIIIVAYVFLARTEERQMLKKFGDQYRKYQNRTPMFLPHWNDLRSFFADYRLAA